MLSALTMSERPEQLSSREETQFSTSVLKMDASSGVWVGTAFLFVQSTSEKIALSSLYNDSKQKPRVYKALKMALSDSAAGGVNTIDMLKVYCSDHQLIIYLKFCDRAICRRFLQSYRDGVVQRSLQEQLQVALSLLAVPIQVELKVGSEKLDDILDEEERCLEYIYKQKPDRLRDEEIAELEECLRTLNCGQEKRTQISQENSSLPGKPQDSLSPGTSERRTVTFLFQAQEFDNTCITNLSVQMMGPRAACVWTTLLLLQQLWAEMTMKASPTTGISLQAAPGFFIMNHQKLHQKVIT